MNNETKWCSNYLCWLPLEKRPRFFLTPFLSANYWYIETEQVCETFLFFQELYSASDAIHCYIDQNKSCYMQAEWNLMPWRIDFSGSWWLIHKAYYNEISAMRQHSQSHLKVAHFSCPQTTAILWFLLSLLHEKHTKIWVTLQSALFLFVDITCAFPERVTSTHLVNSFVMRICYAVDGVSR